jgi:hypothetical protein
MSIPKHGKRDSNEAEIKEALIQAGASVVSLSIPNAPDLLVGYGGEDGNGTTYLLEIKSKRGKLRIGQQYWADSWYGGPVAVVRTVEEALNAVGAA